MNRADLQRLAAERAADAEALLAAGRWSGAYYLAGYAVECALKACVAKRVTQYDFPDKELTQKAYTHNIEALVEAAELKKDRDADIAANAARGRNWQVARRWAEGARYLLWTEPQARELVAAVAEPQNGVLAWITARW